MSREVDVGEREEPFEFLGILRRRGWMPQRAPRTPAGGALAVDLVKAIGQPCRPPLDRIDVDPDRLRLSDRLAAGADRRAALGDALGDAAAPGLELELLADPRHPLDGHRRPADDPGAVDRHPGVEAVGDGGLTEPAGDGVGMGGPGGVHVGAADAMRMGVGAPGRDQPEDSTCCLSPSAAPLVRCSLTLPSTGPRTSIPSIRPGSIRRS